MPKEEPWLTVKSAGLREVHRRWLVDFARDAYRRWTPTLFGDPSTKVRVFTVVNIGVFHGAYGFSGGVHLKACSPPFVRDMVGVVGLAQATMFSSENEHGAYYGGFDGAGALGISVRFPRFGSVAAGAKLYVIEGGNRSYLESEDAEHHYSNRNNVRGWLASSCPGARAITTISPTGASASLRRPSSPA